MQTYLRPISMKSGLLRGGNPDFTSRETNEANAFSSRFYLYTLFMGMAQVAGNTFVSGFHGFLAFRPVGGANFAEFFEML